MPLCTQLLSQIEERFDDLSPEKQTKKQEAKRQQEEAATRVQATYRGMKGRRRVPLRAPNQLAQGKAMPSTLTHTERAGVAALMGRGAPGSNSLLGKARCANAPALTHPRKVKQDASQPESSTIPPTSPPSSLPPMSNQSIGSPSPLASSPQPPPLSDLPSFRRSPFARLAVARAQTEGPV